jgi:two-component system response regulator NreC
MSQAVKVLLADDHTIVRAGIRALLESQPDLVVVGEAVDGFEAIRLADELRPDVVVMDIAMPGMNGLKATKKITSSLPNVRVIALTMHDDEEYFFEVLSAGASGYVLKAAAPAELVSAIRAVHQGNVFLHPSVAKMLVADYMRRVETGEAKTSYDGLTEREKEVLTLIAEGLSSQEIANRLCVSVNTVHVHRARIMEKLNLHSRAELVKYALRKGLIELDN